MKFLIPLLSGAGAIWFWQDCRFCAFGLLGFALLTLVPTLFPGKKKSLKGEVVLITGGGGELGSLMAERFLKQQCTVVLWDLNEQCLEDVKKRIGPLGKVHTFMCDVSNREMVYSVAEKTRREVGDVTILVNNAGIMPAKSFFELPDETIEKVFGVNVLSHFWTIKAFSPKMIAKNSGHIVCIASTAGFLSVSRLSAYCSSKAAAAHLSESLRHELRISGAPNVRTTCIAPYAIRTQLSAGWKDSGVLAPLGVTLLDAAKTADRIIESIQRDEVLVFVPNVISLFHLARFLLPVRPLDAVLVKFGMDEALSGFTGSGRKFH